MPLKYVLAMSAALTLILYLATATADESLGDVQFACIYDATMAQSVTGWGLP